MYPDSDVRAYRNRPGAAQLLPRGTAELHFTSDGTFATMCSQQEWV